MSIISTTTYLTQDLIEEEYIWPVTIESGATVLVSEDLIFTDEDQYFIIGSNGVTFDGQNFSITISNVSKYPGLIKNGSRTDTSPYEVVNYKNYILIKNISVKSDNSYLYTSYSFVDPIEWRFISSGWIGQCYCYSDNLSMTFENCSSNGIISEYCGGIVGTLSSVTINNCNSSGDICSSAGGIAGAYCFNIVIKNSYSTGDITSKKSPDFINDSGNEGGAGIIYSTFVSVSDPDSSSSSSLGLELELEPISYSATIEDCHSTGDIIASYCGGIAYGGNNINIKNCYSEGIIDNYKSAGIIVGINQSIYNIENSYSTGEIKGTECSGIAIGNVDANPDNEITYCYSTGRITGYHCAGIIVYCSENIIIENCYCTGEISGSYNAGISRIGNEISNCYSIGKISGTGCAGICISTLLEDTVITNCFSLGDISSSCAGIVLTSNGSSVTIENCYSNGTIDENGSGIFYKPNNDPSVNFVENVVVKITNCYSSGTYGGNSYGISADSSAIITNCYEANGQWNDTDANEKLITDTTVWYDDPTSFSTPYLLQSFYDDLTGNSTQYLLQSNYKSSSSTTSLTMSSNIMIPFIPLNIGIIYTLYYIAGAQNNSVSGPFPSLSNIIIYTEPQNGQVSINNNLFTYTPDYMFTGINTFVFSYIENNETKYFKIGIIIKPIKVLFPVIWILNKNINIGYKIYTNIIKNFNPCNGLEKLQLLYGENQGELIYNYLFYNIEKYSIYNLCNDVKCHDTNIVKVCDKKYVKTTFSEKSIYKLIKYNQIIKLSKKEKCKLQKKMEHKIKKQYDILCSSKHSNYILYVCFNK